MNTNKESPEEKIFDVVAQYLFNKPLEEARKELALFLFSEWSRTHLNIIFEALSSISNRKKVRNHNLDVD